MDDMSQVKLSKLSNVGHCWGSPLFTQIGLHEFLLIDCSVVQTDCLCLCQVYGETSFELVDQMIKSIDFSSQDTFVDLGSGKCTAFFVGASWSKQGLVAA